MAGEGNLVKWLTDGIKDDPARPNWSLSMMCSCGRPRVYDTECRDCYEDRICRETRHQFSVCQWDEAPSTTTYTDRREDCKYKRGKYKKRLKL